MTIVSGIGVDVGMGVGMGVGVRVGVGVGMGICVGVGAGMGVWEGSGKTVGLITDVLNSSTVMSGLAIAGEFVVQIPMHDR